MTRAPLVGAPEPMAGALLAVANAIAADDHDPARIAERVDEHADVLAPICRTEADLRAVAAELDRWVRWWRAPAYGLTYTFQHLTRRLQSDVHPTAALLYCDAQIACGSDMSLSSAEVAWRASGTEEVAARAVERLRLHHTFYTRWTKPFDYLASDPLSAHLLQLRNAQRLREAYPEVAPALRIGAPRELVRERLETVGRAAEAAGDTWSWVVARRYSTAALSHADAEQLLSHCLDDARRLGLESEIGHLLRLRAWHLKLLARPGEPDPSDRDAVELLRESAELLRAAAAHEQPTALYGFWHGLSLRELGDVLGDRLAVERPEGERLNSALDEAVDAYAQGRRVLDAVLRGGGPIVGAIVKRQMLRSYADNAMRLALTAGRALDALAELESTGPCELADAFAEVRAASALPEEEAEQFLRARAVFARHFTSVPDSFEAYLEHLPRDYELRRAYQRRRGTMTLGAQLTGDAVVERLMATNSDRLFLSFFLGPRHTSHAMLLEPSTGMMLTQELGVTDELLRAAHREYRASVATAPTDPAVTQPALDRFLQVVAGLLRPILGFFAEGDVRPSLTVIPRLELTAIPFAALSVGDRRLIDACADITSVPSLGLAAALLEMGPWPSTDGGVTMLQAGNAPSFAGTARYLATTRVVRQSRDPLPQAALAAIRAAAGADVLFGCHGTFDGAHPERSTLDVGVSGPLTLPDIAGGLALPRARSVTLGACESGAVRSRLGSEYLGLSGALLSAGARSVVASLWKVNQVSTAILAGECLAAMGAGEPPARALMAAQRVVEAMSRDQVVAWAQTYLAEGAVGCQRWLARRPDPPFGHPQDWAGFFVAGVQ